MKRLKWFRCGLAVLFTGLTAAALSAGELGWRSANRQEPQEKSKATEQEKTTSESPAKPAAVAKKTTPKAVTAKKAAKSGGDAVARTAPPTHRVVAYRGVPVRQTRVPPWQRVVRVVRVPASSNSVIRTVADAEAAKKAEPVPPGVVVGEEIMVDESAPCGSGGCGSADCGSGGCDSGGCNECAGCVSGCLPCIKICLDSANFFAGFHGFKGPIDQGRNGNFGIDYGLNMGGGANGPLGLGYQVGFRIAHSDMEGHQVPVNPTSEDRLQTFLTAGIFRRGSPECPWQYGVAWDWLHDEYYIETDLNQIRVELSRLGCLGNEVGFAASIGTGDDVVPFGDQETAEFEAVDQFLFFVRRPLQGCGEGRLWAGFTGGGDALLGGDARMPMSDRLGLKVDVNYLVPHNSFEAGAQEKESWSVSLGLVWYPGCGARGAGGKPFRPLFDVANNTSFIVGRSH